MKHGVKFRDVVENLISRYREDVLDEVAEDVERYVVLKVWELIIKKSAVCAGVEVLHEDIHYLPEFRECFEKILKEVVRG